MSAWELRQGDCLDPTTGLASLADGSIDAFVMDPPYAEQTHAGARSGKGDKELLDFSALRWDDAVSVLMHAARIARRWVVATMDWKHVARLEADPVPGLRFIRFGVWIKPNGAPQFTGDRPGQGWEAVAILHRDGERMRWNGGGDRAVWTFNKENGIHPTQKPLPLFESFVRLFTDPGDTICDPFAGSGTSLVAAVRLGRRAIGWERDPKYHAAAMRRLSGTSEQRELFGAPKPARVEQFSLLPDPKTAAR